MQENDYKALKIIRLKDVQSLTGLSRSSIYSYVKKGTFPKSVNLGGRCTGWVKGEIDQWIQGRVQMRLF